MDAIAREGSYSLVGTYHIKFPKGRREGAPRSGVIAIFVILTPPDQGTKTARNEHKFGSHPFTYVSRIDV